MNECEGCIKICCESVGILKLSKEDIIKLSEHMQITIYEFQMTYTNVFWGERIMKSLPTGECVFLKDKLCSVYIARPIECIQFPKIDDLNNSIKKYCKLWQRYK